MDKPGLLSELTYGLFSVVGPRGGRKGLEAVLTEEMTFEVSPGRRPGLCPSDKAGRVFLVERATMQMLGDMKISWSVQGLRSFSLAQE